MSARLMKKVLNEQHHLQQHVSEEEEEEEEEENDSEPITRSSINPFDLLNDQDSEPENQVFKKPHLVHFDSNFDFVKHYPVYPFEVFMHHEIGLARFCKSAFVSANRSERNNYGI
ncbi:hypothetical protein V8G54_003465 [Vigna mungo]|uniref:Uncharacterized protein n=1 Tax=Vigna mungo TaxID=3915 RepID=A0AAQ3PBU3_VIGMU